MVIINDPRNIFQRLKYHINKFGNSPNHNPIFLLDYYIPIGYRPIYFDFKIKGGVLVYTNQKIAQIITGPIAPAKFQRELFLATAPILFKRWHIKKLLIEDCSIELRKEILKYLPSLRLRARSPAILLWPVLDLVKWSEKCEGKKWKGIRYARNLFLKNPDIKIKDAKLIKKDKLYALIKKWRTSKKGERVYYRQYDRAVKKGFLGCDLQKAILIKERPIALTAGWRIPNSKGYYHFISIHDYDYEYLGEFANFVALSELKQREFSFIDFGGSEKGLLAFKMKFHPTGIYKTYSFYVAPK